MRTNATDQPEIASLFHLRNTLLQTQSFDQILATALDQAREKVQAQGAAVYLFCKDGYLRRRRTSGTDRDGSQITSDWYVEERVAPGVSFTGKVLVPTPFGSPRWSNDLDVEDVSEESRAKYREKFGALRSGISIPLNGKHRTFGVLEVINKLDDDGLPTEGATFTDDDAYWMSLIGMNLATAVSRFRLTEEQALLAAVSKRVIEAVSEESNPQAFYDFITQELVSDVTNYKACILRIGNTADHLETVSRAGQVSWEAFPTLTDFSEGILGTMYSKLEPQIVSHLPAHERQFRTSGWIKANGLQSYVGIPLRLGKIIFGSLSLFTAYTYNFSADHILFLQNIAFLIASYRESRRLTEENQKIRADIFAVSEQMVHNAQKIRLDQEVDAELHRLKNVFLNIRRDLKDVQPEVPGRASAVLSRQLDVIDRQIQAIENRFSEVPDSRIQPNHIVQTVVRYFKNLLQGRKIIFDLEYGDVPDIHASDAEITEIIRNVLSNAVRAIEAAKRKQGVIRIATGVTSGERIPMIRITVEDNGTGIRNEDRDRIFDRGFSRSPGGTGMGLYISKILVEGYGGGVIVIDSTVGKGTTFEIRLPLKRLQYGGARP